jgi:UDP-glucose 4-epimerase
MAEPADDEDPRPSGRSLRTVLVTGGAGFFGGILLERLLRDGVRCVSIDLERHELSHPDLEAVQGDITDTGLMERLYADHEFDAVFHCAAMLAHAVKDRDVLWRSNVDGTRIVSEQAAKHGVPKLVFTSSNCLWGENMGRPVREDDPPRPVEIYGRSKWEGEKALDAVRDLVDVTVIRCPTIIDAGRLGLLAILFEFIAEGRKIPMVGTGDNRYQFIYAPDLADACIRAAQRDGGAPVYNIGSDDVKTMRQVYERVIEQAGTGSRIRRLPKAPTIAAMRLAGALKLSPLGPYHYRMIAEDFVFDTTLIRSELGWRPTLTNEGMLHRAYEHYVSNLDEIRRRTDVSAHRQVADMGAIRLLKWIS